MSGLPKCPLESVIDKEECSVAGLSIGGTLQNNELVEDAWNDKPSGCFLTEDDHIIHFNSNPVGTMGDNFVSVCRKIEVRFDSTF